jgi:aminopeptidase N
MKTNTLGLKLSLCASFLATVSISVSAEEQATICRYCEHAQQAAPSSDGTNHYAPDRVVDVLHIKLDVTPNFVDESVSVNATLKFVPLMKPLEELRLDAVELDVKSVKGSSMIVDYAASAEDVTILFDPPIPPGAESSVEIEYTAHPTKGLYFRTPNMGYPATDTHLWTQGEPHEARHWFPCFDYPNERSSTEIICHVPADMTVLSNGKLVDESTNGDVKSVHWRQDKPHASYLICLVAGHLEKLEKNHRDVPLAFFTQPTLAQHAKNSFQDTPDIMAFFEEEIGIPFPWDKYFQVTIRDFMWGGMENTSLTTLTDRTIFSDATENIHSSRGLDAHEMAHQWFGDFVTCKDWSHLWLNEGFATFYTHLYHGHKSGHDEMLYGLYRDARGRILTQGKDRRPIVYKGYGSPGEQFDYRAYPKGSWVLHMLRSQLGANLYRKCIKTYLERHALSPVTTADLARVVEELSGQSFDRFFDQWTYRPRFPDIDVSFRWIAKTQQAHVTVKQTHEINDDVRLFEFPTTLRFIVDGQVVDHDVEISDKRHDFYFELADEPQVFRFDPNYTLLADVSITAGSRRGKSDSMLAAQLNNHDDVMGRLLAVAELSKRTSRPAKREAAKLLSTVLHHDPFWGVRREAAVALRKLDTDESYAALADSVQQDNAKVRDAVVSELGRFYRPETLTTLQELYAAESNPAIRSSIVRALGKFDSKQTQPILKQALADQTFRMEEVSAAIDAVRTQNNAALRKALQKTLAERDDELGSRTLGKGLTTLAQLNRKVRKKAQVRAFIEDYLDHPKSTVKVAAVRALGELGDKQATGVLESLSSDRDDRLAQAAKDALKKLRDEKTFVPAEVAELRKSLAELRDEYEGLRDELEQLKLSSGATKDESPEADSESSASEAQDELTDEFKQRRGKRKKKERERQGREVAEAMGGGA